MLLTTLAIQGVLLALLRDLRCGWYLPQLMLTGLAGWGLQQQGMVAAEFHSTGVVLALGIHVLCINLLLFLLYGWDKRMARRGGWRVPERVLQGMALVGGTFGALAGQKWFRHKTVKRQFRTKFFVILTVQVVLVLAVVFLLFNPHYLPVL